MNIDEQVLNSEREGLEKEFNSLKEKITNLEVDLGGMRSQLNALHGAKQQCESFLKDLNNDDQKQSKSAVGQ